MTKTAKETETVTLPALTISTVKVRVEGALLVLHNFDEKSRAQMERASTGRARTKVLVDVNAKFNDARYVADGKDCCLAIHFKKAMISASNDVKMKMTDIRRQLFCRGTLKGGEYVQLFDAATGKPAQPILHKAWVRQQNGKSATMAYRPSYENWAAEVIVEYNASAISAEQILNLMTVAGFSCGIGENRPSKSGGDWGRFTPVLSRTTAKKSA